MQYYMFSVDNIWGRNHCSVSPDGMTLYRFATYAEAIAHVDGMNNV